MLSNLGSRPSPNRCSAHPVTAVTHDIYMFQPITVFASSWMHRLVYYRRLRLLLRHRSPSHCRVPPSMQNIDRKVRLGCNEGWRKGCSNYFLLIGADDPFTRLHPTTGTRGSSVGFSTVQRQKLSPPQPAPPPPPSPSPTGLLPDADRDEGTGTGAGGGSTAVSPRWVLRPHMVAGGKGSLAQAVRALVDERRKSRAMSRSQLLPGACMCVVCM